jgi:CSLREA domain-containing protein
VDVQNDESDGSCAVGDCSLREAIIAANGAGGADEISLPAGTYYLTITGKGEDSAATGDLDVTGALTISGAGPGSTIIDASGLISDRVFHVLGGPVHFRGVTIMGGHAVTDTGGGILVDNSTVSITDTVVMDNVATGGYPVGWGGGISVIGGSGLLNLLGGQVISNTASRHGGGVHIYQGYANLSAGLIASNTAGLWGGGVEIWGGGATLEGTSIISNTAVQGGGVYVYYNNDPVIMSGGLIADNEATNTGGGVGSYSGDFSLDGLYIRGNRASAGGGLYVQYEDTVTMSAGQIVSNTATSYGGGIFVAGTDSVFTQTGTSCIGWNEASGGGGAYVASGIFAMNGGIIIGNSAQSGGGVFVHWGSATLNSGAIISNTVDSWGGGLYLDDASGTAVVQSTAFWGNEASIGGAIRNSYGTLTLVNTTLSHNTASFGGGISVYTGTTAMTYSTIVSNTSFGIYYDGPITIKNTIVAHNANRNCDHPNGSGIVSNGHNLENDDTCEFTSNTDITNTVPLLGPLTLDNGAWVHPLLFGSPAVDTGLCVPSVTTVDQRGTARPFGSYCDIGAYEQHLWESYLPVVLKENP